MERWAGKVAVVTGASSGIGAAIAKALANAGMVVIGLARRVERVEELKKDLPASVKGSLHAAKCDVSKEEDILKTFAWIEKKFGGVDVLINNAGILRDTTLAEADTQKIREVLDTNVMGLVICSREAYQSMKKRSVDGHIIHINSVAGHMVPNFPRLNIYPASKHAVTAITETMRQELRTEGTKIKVTSISPGGVRTEILPEAALTMEMPLLESEDIAEAVLYVIGTPPHVQVHELTIKPIGEIF
ncbi:farnesol dehydrogenase-like [Wyeomyia smithii]|uniref:farnesol dehydrogenase-like n=1 Tax=Wyeomyia smithii TaxID=174621 RepID=UPI002467E96E|nr:farnesol dehydrogenase-like [Wyeomyia smithii]